MLHRAAAWGQPWLQQSLHLMKQVSLEDGRHGPTCECGILNIHGLEPSPGPEYGGGDEGADGGGQQWDVGVDVGAVPGVVWG